MKVKIQFDKKEDYGDYIIVSPQEDLSNICEDAECIELIADDILGYFPGNQVNTILHHWIKKIRIGGTIVITGIDLSEVMRGIQGRSINLTEANILLYGNQEKPYEFRASCLNGLELSKTLKQFGFKIVKNSIENFRYIVKAERINDSNKL